MVFALLPPNFESIGLPQGLETRLFYHEWRLELEWDGEQGTGGWEPCILTGPKQNRRGIAPSGLVRLDEIAPQQIGQAPYARLMGRHRRFDGVVADPEVERREHGP